MEVIEYPGRALLLTAWNVAFALHGMLEAFNTCSSGELVDVVIKKSSRTSSPA